MPVRKVEVEPKSINMKQPPPEGLRARKRREVRQRLSDTATRLFLERGFDAVSVEEVARAADVSRATVFNYFECKEDLLLDRAPELAEHVGRALKAARPAGALPALRDALLETGFTTLNWEIDTVLNGIAALGNRVAPLPTALLGAKKPARAFVGHVEPTFDWTLQNPDTNQILTDSIQKALLVIYVITAQRAAQRSTTMTTFTIGQ
jgi:AcrR family transcriptional regulator